MPVYGIVAHGGAGNRRPANESVLAVREAVEKGYRMLEQGGSALDAVEGSIVLLENHPNFNAGTGSRLQLDGVARMDAAIMEGSSLKAGAVAAIENIRNPIRAARAVMEKTEHVMLVGDGARRFAAASGIEEGDVRTERRIRAWQRSLEKDHVHIQILESVYGGETVGVVAVDMKGQVASGSSTGGAPFMLPGRVGDTPVIGAGVYADSKIGAATATGIGEYIVRTVLSRAIVELMARGVTPGRALKTAIGNLRKITGGQVGAVAIDRKGRAAAWHNTRFMSYCCMMRGRRVKMGASAE
ncbi:MAG: isoaspartyl peptidase/L-asparaginase family protein [bacterium]